MRLVLLVLLATTSAILSGNDFKDSSMTCTIIKENYNRVQSHIKSNPLYKTLKDRTICHREETEFYYQKTCCDNNQEIALAITSATLFQRYIFNDCLKVFVMALNDMREYYRNEVGDVFNNPDMVKAIMRYTDDYTPNTYTNKYKMMMFKVLYREEVNPSADVSEEHCLKQAKNFNQNYDLSANTLNKYFTLLAALKHGIQLAQTLIESLQSQLITPKCIEAVTKSSVLTLGCNQCKDSTAIYKTCKTYCANVVNGCLKPLLPILPIWKTWYKIMDTLDSVVTQRKTELIDQNISDKLSSSFNKDYNNRLSVYCLKSTRRYSSGKLGRRKRSYRVSDGDSDSRRPLQDRHYYVIFNDMFDKIQHTFCRTLDFASTSDTNCWNGTYPAPYTRNVTKFNEVSQLENEEVRDSGYIVYDAQQALKQLQEFNTAFQKKLDDEDDIRLYPENSTGDAKVTEGSDKTVDGETGATNTSESLFATLHIILIGVFIIRI